MPTSSNNSKIFCFFFFSFYYYNLDHQESHWPTWDTGLDFSFLPPLSDFLILPHHRKKSGSLIALASVLILVTKHLTRDNLREEVFWLAVWRDIVHHGGEGTVAGLGAWLIPFHEQLVSREWTKSGRSLWTLKAHLCWSTSPRKVLPKSSTAFPNNITHREPSVQHMTLHSQTTKLIVFKSVHLFLCLPLTSYFKKCLKIYLVGFCIPQQYALKVT